MHLSEKLHTSGIITDWSGQCKSSNWPYQKGNGAPENLNGELSQSSNMLASTVILFQKSWNWIRVWQITN